MATKGHPSPLLFYFVAAALGLAFSVALVVLAWNNVVQNETRNFEFDAIAAQNSVEGSIRTADAVIDNLASFVDANPAAYSTGFRNYTAGTLQRYAFITGLSQATIAVDGVVQVVEAVGEVPNSTLLSVIQSEETQRIVRQDLGTASAAFTAGYDDRGAHADILFLIQLVPSSEQTHGNLEIVALAIDLGKLVNAIAVDPALNLALYTESEGVAGRRLIYAKQARPNVAGTIVETLNEESNIRLNGFSVRLASNKDILWRDLDNELVFVALFLGLGVTLLLVALARAKDMQAKELEARNRVIEEQVKQQTKELALARDQALEASRVKSDFLASMSHEIRTPLNAIIGMAELLSESKLDDEQEKYVGVFRNAGEALLSLVNDILDLSKIEAEQLTLEDIDFELLEIVEQAAEIYALKADSRNIDLITIVAPDVPRSVTGDPGRIRQIILNLIGNAIKFTDEGQITVRVTVAEAATNTPMVRFEVADSGIGIPPEKLEAIFSNFTQVDSSITRKYGGTGLGLAICKRLVELMGGRIWAESQPGAGSSFRFEAYLPSAAATPRARIQLPPLRRVVIVEPNYQQGLALVEFLQAHDVRTQVMASGDSLLASITDAQQTGDDYDLAVIDAGHDIQASLATIQRLRATRANLPVVSLFRPSTLAEGVAAMRGVAASAYIVKPVRQHQFIEAIQRALAGAERREREVVIESSIAVESARILLVEDNPDNRLLVKAYLKQLPYELVEAENGALAVDAFKASAFDLVLMDVQMPVMDGYAATRAMRSWEREHNKSPTVIVALTANAVKEDIENSRAAGCDAHLTKPIKKEILVDAVQHHVSASQTQRA